MGGHGSLLGHRGIRQKPQLRMEIIPYSKYTTLCEKYKDDVLDNKVQIPLKALIIQQPSYYGFVQSINTKSQFVSLCESLP